MISARAVGFSGFAIVDDVLDAAEIHQLQRLMESVVSSEQGRGGVRNLLDIPEVRELAGSEAVTKLVRPILGEAAFPVRGILFDKKMALTGRYPGIGT
jgi:hypothetical protein